MIRLHSSNTLSAVLVSPESAYRIIRFRYADSWRGLISMTFFRSRTATGIRSKFFIDLVRNLIEDLRQKPLAVFNDTLLVTGRAKVAALARKRQEIFVAAMVASNPGEAASQVAAVQISINRDFHSDKHGTSMVANNLQIFVGSITR